MVMATSSPRDHTADARQDLARKKARLSESEDTGNSPTGSIVVELCDPEPDEGASNDNPIEIVDDISIAMEPYSADFEMGYMHPPIVQLARLQADIAQNCYIDPDHVSHLSNALRIHLDRTADQETEWRHHYLDSEVDFFNRVATFTIELLAAGELFESPVDVDPAVMRKVFYELIDGLGELSLRVIPFLPDAIKSTLSRRDSAQVSSRQPHTLGSLYYIMVALRAVMKDSPTAQYWQSMDRRFKLDNIIKRNRDRFCETGITSALTRIIKMLGGAMREVKDSWMIMLDALKLFNVLINQHRSFDEYPKVEMEEVLETICTCILPMICEKHPRALPEGFHNDVVDVGRRTIATYVEVHDQESAYELYNRFIKGNSDAVIPESTSEESKSALLWQVCGRDQHAMAELLTTAWTMQARLAFITSEIMDIRNIGISALASSLVELHEKQRSSPERLDHPLIQYAVRFLRQNELTGYIFGPESRAGLVSHSSNIICFLGATSTYTNAETDIIWRACSTSVEADFVKASFLVLGTLLKFLDFEHLLYLVKKYPSTSIDRLGSDAVEFLPTLLREIEERSSALTEQTDRLSVAFANMDILKHVNTAEYGPSSGPLRQIASTEIMRLAGPDFASEDREEVYKALVPEIQNGTSYATTAVEVLGIFLNSWLSPVEAQHLLALLPPEKAVEELCNFVHANVNCVSAQKSIPGAIARLSCITRLISLSNCAVDDGTKLRLFTCAFGEAALCQEARSAAWEKLQTMASYEKPPSAALHLWSSFMQDHVPALSANLATPRLIDLIFSYITNECKSESTPITSDYTELLQYPLWNTLVRFATNSADIAVISASTHVIHELLFGYGVAVGFPRASVEKCHGDFTRKHIKDLCADYSQLIYREDKIVERRFLLGIDLLTVLLFKSRETANLFSLMKPAEVILIGAQGGPEIIHFTAQIYGSEVQPKTMTVNAKGSTKVAELLSQLSQFTGVEENRVIAGGVEVTHLLEKSLSDVGIKHLGVIMIRPKYSCGLDLDKVLIAPGPVEQEILDQSEALDKFLDGPEHLANTVFRFLQHIRLSVQSRSRVSSPNVTAQDIFPPERPIRTAFSLFVLQHHLHEYVRLGVANDDFARRAVSLLAAYVTDESRPRGTDMKLSLTYEIFRTLLHFLRELPIASTEEPYFADAERFVSATIDLVSTAIRRPAFEYQQERSKVYECRKECAVTAYRALLLACQKDDSTWKSFSQYPRIIGLHSQLLLDENTELSHEVAETIGNLCLDFDCPREFTEFYWKTISAGVSEALQKGRLSHNYFRIAVEVAKVNEVLKSDESQARELVAMLVSKLWSYKHIESPSFRIMDTAMLGILRLLSLAVWILRSYKKPLLMDGFATRMFRELLFPDDKEGLCHPLVSNETRAVALDLVRSSFESEGDYDALLATTCNAILKALRDSTAVYPGQTEWVRSCADSAGLKNLGMTCYMNSLLQQLFGNLQFRKFILGIPLTIPAKQSVLYHVQMLFANMQDSTSPVAETQKLAEALDIQVGNQEDVHTFYTTLLSRLEEEIPDTTTKAKLNGFFTGKSVTQVKGECEHVSTRSEPFTELSITVKNKASLHDSLEEFVQGEPLEGANKYMCMTCASNEEGKLVNAMRRTCLEDVPDNLAFCLKRFTYESMLEGENKVNDRFEFPKEIDMSLYKRSYLENPAAPRNRDDFELVGVIVHQGSLQFGHYWSYVRLPNVPEPDMNGWVYLEDNKFIRCQRGIQEVQDQCFGGLRWSGGTERPDNAYVLFYQRKTYIEEATAMARETKQLHPEEPLILSRVALPETVAREVVDANFWRHQMSSLFTANFSSFVVWLLEQFPAVLKARNAEVDEEASSDQSEASVQSRIGGTDAKIADMITHYALRILMADPASDTRVGPFMSALTTILEKWPQTATHILKHFCGNANLPMDQQDMYPFSCLVRHKNTKTRAQLFHAVESCLDSVRECDWDAYESLIPDLIAAHASLQLADAAIPSTLDSSCAQWDEYLKFAANFARHGMLETEMILQNGYLRWALDTTYARCDMETRKRRQMLFMWEKNNNQIDRSSLYAFAFRLLSKHVDLTIDPNDIIHSRPDRQQTTLGWGLNREEVGLLAKQRANGPRDSLLLFAASKSCNETSSWKEYAPGKLIGLLVSDKAHTRWRDYLLEQLRTQYDHEQQNMQPLLNMTMHYCANAGEAASAKLLRSLCNSLSHWEGIEKKSLYCLRQAFAYTPVAVLESIMECEKAYLFAKSMIGRQVMKHFLQDLNFDPSPLSDDPALDAVRIKNTRILVNQCTPSLRQAYDNHMARARYEDAIETMENARQYLTQLHSDVTQRNSQDGPALSQRVMVEYDESRATLQALVKLLTDLEDWEPATSLPTRLHSVQQSVEDDSEEEVEMTDDDADADGDDLSSNV